jgi:heptosyltransferase I
LAGTDLAADSANLRTRDFQRILLIKLSAVGDVVHTMPALNRLRRRYPAARIDWLVKPSIAELVREHPALTNVVLFMRDESLWPWQAGWTAIADGSRLMGQLRAAQYDLVIDLHGQLRTAILTMATGAPVRIGFDRPRAGVWNASERKLPSAARKHAWQGAREGSWLAYTHRISVPTLDVHAADRYLRVSAMLGLDDDGVDFSFVIPPACVASADSLLNRHGLEGGPFAIIAPGTIWETKRWSNAGFAQLARHLLKAGVAVVLVGSKAERDMCEEIAAAAPGSVNIAGNTTIGELAATVCRALVCVTNDSGPMHLAVALDRPVVSIFGPTDPLWVGPYRQADAVLRAELDCSPCYLRRLSQCPHDHACMRNVSAEAVIDRVESTLARARARAAAAPEQLPASAGARWAG